MKRAALAFSVGLLGASTVACAGAHRIEQAELPASPIAILHRTPEESRRRAELLQRLRGEQPRRTQASVLELDDVRRRLGRGGDALAPGRLALLDPRTGDLTRLEAAPRGSRPLSRSPDGRKLLFAAPYQGAFQLFVLDRESGEVRRRTGGPYEHSLGCLLGDGRLVAVERRGRGDQTTTRLVLFGRGGRLLRELTAGPFDVQPACAPDGSRIAFVRLVARGRTDVVVIPSSGEAPARAVGRGVAPSFSPDGAWIVYSADTSRGRRLWRVRADGSGRRSLGSGHLEEIESSVSPDGRFVVYVVEEKDRQRLRVRRVDGSGDRPLFDAGDAMAPVW